MPVDPELLAGLRAAVEAVPDNLALRLHVAILLLEAGRPAESLEHSSAVLALVPGHGEATRLVERFLTTPFSGDPRHLRRIEMIAAYESSHVLPDLPELPTGP